MFISGHGVNFVHEDGKEYLDFTSGGIFAAALGNNPDAIYKQIFEDFPMISCYGAHYKNPTTERYKKMLCEWAGFESCALFTTGSEANEAYWRAMRIYTCNLGVWGGLIDPDEVGTDGPLSDAMHGLTLGSMIMAGKITEPGLGIGPEMGANRFGLAPENTGCMIMEPYHAPSAQFHRIDPTIKRIAEHQKEFPEIPLCIDEIQGGFGRTGKKWAHQWYQPSGDSLVPKGVQLNPDFITIGKGAGAGLPISALLGPKEIMESKVVVDHAHLHSTHSGNPVMAGVGCAVIEQIEYHDLISQSYDLGIMLDAALKDCGIRYHAGRGLLAGLEFENADEAKLMTQLCYDKGLLVCDTGRKWVKLGPALIITSDELASGAKIIREAIGEVLDARNP